MTETLNLRHRTQPNLTDNKYLVRIFDLTPKTASKTVGISFLIMFPLSIIAVLMVLEQLVIPGDNAKSIENINNNMSLLYIGVIGYFIILSLDSIIAIALYSVTKYSNKNVSKLMSGLRLIFAVVTAFSLVSLLFVEVKIYHLAKLLGFVFLIPHLFFLGYLCYKSSYIPKVLGILLIIASFAYIITIFGEYFLSGALYDILYMIAMIPASLAEISLGIWLLLRSNNVQEKIYKLV